MRRIGYLLLDTILASIVITSMVLNFLGLGVVKAALHLSPSATFAGGLVIIMLVTIAFVKEERAGLPETSCAVPPDAA